MSVFKPLLRKIVFWKVSPNRLGQGLIVGLILGWLVSRWLLSGSLVEGHLPLNPALRRITPEANTTIADQLFEKVRVLCWVMTYPRHHKSLAREVKRTWGKRCNKLLFISTQEDTHLPTVKLEVTEHHANLWVKTKETFKYIYVHHINEYDWFLKADDDTYVIMENLRHVLLDYNSSQPIYLGRKFDAIVNQGYMSGGAGYVLSREAVRRMVQAVYSQNPCAINYGEAEDVIVGMCLEKVNVDAIDSRDVHGRPRCFPINPYNGMYPILDWYFNYSSFKIQGNLNDYSDEAISFHYVSKELVLFEYLIYHLRPYGINYVYRSPFNEEKREIKPKSFWKFWPFSFLFNL